MRERGEREEREGRSERQKKKKKTFRPSTIFRPPLLRNAATSHPTSPPTPQLHELANEERDMAATAEAPVAEVSEATTIATKQQASSSASKQAEEPVPVVSSLASVYPDGKKKKRETLSLSSACRNWPSASFFALHFVDTCTTLMLPILRGEEGRS